MNSQLSYALSPEAALAELRFERSISSEASVKTEGFSLTSGAAGLSLSRHGTKDPAAGHARDAVRNLVQMFAFHSFEPIPAGIANSR